VAVDATICRIVDLGIDKVPYFESAWERGLGNFAEDTIEIRGRTIGEVFNEQARTPCGLCRRDELPEISG